MMLCYVRRKLRAVVMQKSCCACSAWRLQLACMCSAEGREPSSLTRGRPMRAAGKAVLRLCNFLQSGSGTDGPACAAAVQDKYTFMESARVLMQERDAPSLVDRPGPVDFTQQAANGCSVLNNQSQCRLRLKSSACRWDWHAWQLFVACLPPVGMPYFCVQGKPFLYIDVSDYAAPAAAVVALAAYARKDMRERNVLLQSEVGLPLAH